MKTMRVTQKLVSGLVVRQDIPNAVRPVFFKTDFEEWLYATHGGTLSLIRFRGRVYGLTCNHVFMDFPTGRLFIVGKKYAQKGNLPGGSTASVVRQVLETAPWTSISAMFV